MANPWLSVIIPSHNGERWLAAALQSIVDQSERDIEVILLDSSDSDESWRIAAQFTEGLNLRSFRRADVLPWTAKTNFAVELARAKWICMLHQDDLWLPGRGAALRRWIRQQSDGVMHLHPAYVIDERGKRLGIWRCPLPASEAPIPTELLFDRLLVQEFIAIPAPTIRRDAFINVGGLDNSLQQTADWDLYLKLCQSGNVYYHSEPLACFRIHGNSLTMMNSRKLQDYRNQLETVLDRHIGKLSSGTKRRVRSLAMASIDINMALAAASAGNRAELLRATASLLSLGPGQIYRYFYYSRIIERAIPRLKVRLAGGL
jgi:glycosyltransferase involved in cell wall biosynthesis